MKEYNFDNAWNDVGGIYNGDDDDIRKGIADALCNIPEDVKEYVLDECFFLSAGKYSYGTVWPIDMLFYYGENSNIARKWLILLSENIPDEDVKSVVAHEIAHAYLKHDKLADLPKEIEKDACNLVIQWGIGGIGADIEYCYKSIL